MLLFQFFTRPTAANARSALAAPLVASHPSPAAATPGASFDAAQSAMENLLAALDGARAMPAAQASRLLGAALMAIDALPAADICTFWDELEGPAAASDARYSGPIRAQLTQWLTGHAALRAEELIASCAQHGATDYAVKLARRLQSQQMYLVTLPHGRALAALEDSYLHTQYAVPPPGAAASLIFLPMHKRPAVAPERPAVGKKDAGVPSYLYDVQADRYFRVAKTMAHGSFMKVRPALDEDGQPWVFRVGHLLPKVTRSNVMHLEADLFGEELAAMQAAQSPLQPHAIYAHTYYRLFLQTEYMAFDLHQVWSKFRADDALCRLRRPILRQMVWRVLGELTKLHDTGRVHLDIKPENIFFTPTGQARLGDYGFAAKSAQVQSLRGTFGWLAPEMLELHKAQVTPAADLWSLGLVTLAALAPLHWGALPLAAANSETTSKAANDGYRSWAPQHLARASRGARRTLGEVVWRRPSPKHADDNPYGAAVRAAAAADPALARLFLARVLTPEAKARPSAGELQKAMEKKFGLGYLTDARPGQQLVAQLDDPAIRRSKASFAELAQLPARPKNEHA